MNKAALLSAIEHLAISAFAFGYIAAHCNDRDAPLFAIIILLATSVASIFWFTAAFTAQ